MIIFKTDIEEKTPGKTPGKTLGKTLGKTPLQILKILSDQPILTISEIAKMIKKSDSATERAIRKLREADLIKRIGPAKGGYWKIIRKKKD
jgi:predicted HTH transcriptional regulator